MMDWNEWLEGLGCLIHVVALIAIASIVVEIAMWITSLIF